MMVVFFVGIGLTSIATSFAQSPQQIAVLLFFVGVLAAIYHPVGLAMVVEGAKSSATGMALAINGVWGNFGVGSAALITGYLIDHSGWRVAFIVPGVVSLLIGLAYWRHARADIAAAASRQAKPGQISATEILVAGYLIPISLSVGAIVFLGYGLPAIAICLVAGLTPPFLWMARQAKAAKGNGAASSQTAEARRILLRLTAIIFFTAAVSSLVFQSTTFALPKVFDERLQGIAGSATLIGWLAFVVFAIASIAQLVVGSLLDRLGPRPVFMTLALVQVAFFALMPGLRDWPALAVALGFMLGAFGQIPINDYMIGRMAKSELRATIYGMRYIVSFTVLAAALPLIALIHQKYGFDTLFRVLSAAAFLIFLAVTLLPRQIPDNGAVPAAAKA